MSAKDPIEELFRDNQHGLDEQPRNLVWNRIEEKLEDKSHGSKRINWWKYAVSACFIAGLSFASYLFLFDSNPVADETNEVQIVHQPTEITQENASEILDKLEEKKQAIVTTETHTDAPEIFKEKELSPQLKPALRSEVYDMAPAEAMVYEPASEMSEIKASEEKIASMEKEESDQGSIVFRGNTPEKKGKNYITQKGIDDRRMGNAAFEEQNAYPGSITQMSIPYKKYILYYDLTAQDETSAVFSNLNVAYPNQIIFQKTNDSIQVIYQGDYSKRKTTESKHIQQFIEENKSSIIKDLDLN